MTFFSSWAEVARLPSGGCHQVFPSYQPFVLHGSSVDEAMAGQASGTAGRNCRDGFRKVAPRPQSRYVSIPASPMVSVMTRRQRVAPWCRIMSTAGVTFSLISNDAPSRTQAHMMIDRQMKARSQLMPSCVVIQSSDGENHPGTWEMQVWSSSNLSAAKDGHVSESSPYRGSSHLFFFQRRRTLQPWFIC